MLDDIYYTQWNGDGCHASLFIPTSGELIPKLGR